MSKEFHPEGVLISRRKRGNREPRIDPQDFRQPTRPRGIHQKALKVIANRFGFAIGHALANYLRVPVEADVASVEIMPFADAVERLAEKPWWIPLVAPDDDRCVLILDHVLQWNMINHLLGNEPRADKAASAGEEEDAETTAIRPIDVDVIGPVSRAALRTFVASLVRESSGVFRDDREPFTIDDDRRGEGRSRFMRGSDRVTRFSVTLREGPREAVVELLAGEAVLAPLLEVDDGEPVVPKPVDRTEVENLVRALDVTFAARLGNAYVDMRELMALKPGEVLVLDRRVGEPLELLVGSKEKFMGQPGRSSGRNAVRILSRIEGEVGG